MSIEWLRRPLGVATLGIAMLSMGSPAIASSVLLQWNANLESDIAGYIVSYGTQSGQYNADIDVGNQTTATVTGLTEGIRYYFVVRAYNAAPLISLASAEVSGIVFVDSPLIPTVTTIKAVHITELRARVNALRAACGIGTFSFVDAALSAGATTVKAAHVVELRDALAAAYSACSRTSPTYTDSSLTAGTFIKAVHIVELRTAVLALENN
jgi:hypothetical protein